MKAQLRCARIAIPWPPTSAAIRFPRALINFFIILLGLAASPAATAGDLVSIPLRWCALENTPTVNDPSSAPIAPEETVDGALWRRHERASDSVWIPQANITFRSAFTAELADVANFPVIADQCPPRGTQICRGGDRAGFTCSSDDDCGGESCAASTCPPGCPSAACNGGQVGDVHSGVSTGGVLEALERDMTVNACNMAWQALNDAGDTNTPGVVAINANRVLSRFGGGPGDVAGFAEAVPLGADDDVCPPGAPTLASDFNGGSVVIIDHQNFSDLLSDAELLAKQERRERTLAHELGHVFQVWHGNGLDDDADGGFDQVCDPPDAAGEKLEEGADGRWCAGPGSIMSQDACPDDIANLNMTGNQTAVVQGVANTYLNMVMDPPGVITPGDSIGDHRFDGIGDGTTRQMDLRRLDYQANISAQQATLRLALAGVLTLGPAREYWMLFDVDGDPAAGGDPDEELGAGTPFVGTDLAVRLLVLSPAGANAPVVVSAVWTHDGTAFSECDPNFFPECFAIDAAIEPVFTVSDSVGGGFERLLSSSNLRVRMPLELVQNPSDSMRVFAKSRLFSDSGEAFEDDDCLPGCDIGDGATLHVDAPNFPVCTTNPLRAAPGQTIQVIASNFTPDGGRAKAYVGDRKVALGDPATGALVDDVAIDAAGVATFAITIPADARTGTRLLTVGLVGKALTADCPLELEQDIQITGAPVGGGVVRIGLDGQLVTIATNEGDGASGVVAKLQAFAASDPLLKRRGTVIVEQKAGVFSVNANVTALESTDAGVEIRAIKRDAGAPQRGGGKLIAYIVIVVLIVAIVLIFLRAARTP